MASIHVFISYRHAEAALLAAHIAKVLVEWLGEHRVFLDKTGIEAGDEFPRKIADALHASTVVLVVIGSQWLTIKDESNKRKLENPKDFVRIEIATALQSGKRVIPLLVDAAKMPDADDLPTPLKRLAELHAVQLDNQRITADVAHLRDVIDPNRRRRLLLTALVVGLLLAPSLFFSLGYTRFFEGFFGLDIYLESLLAAYSSQHATTAPAKIALVAVDAESQDRLHIEPKNDPAAWRKYHADLIRNLTAAGVRMIVFDLTFDEASEYDELMHSALQEAKGRGVPVIAAATSFDIQGNPLSRANFKDAVTAWGHACLGMKNNALPTVNLALQRKGSDIMVVSLSLAALQNLPAASNPDLFHIGPYGGLQIKDGTGRGRYVDFPGQTVLDPTQTSGTACEAQNADDTVFPLRLDLTTREQLHNRSDDYAKTYALLVSQPSEAILSAFKNKIVIVGDQSDIKMVMRGVMNEEIYGFELQADAIRTLLEIESVRDVLRALDTPWQVVLITVVCVLGMLLALFAEPLPRAWCVLLLCACAVAYGALAVLVYRDARIVLPLSYPSAAALLTFFATRSAFAKGVYA